MSTDTETAAARSGRSAGLGTLARRGLAAVVVADVVNVAIVFAADRIGVAPNLDPLSYGPVLLFTTVGVVGAAVLALLHLTTAAVAVAVLTDRYGPTRLA